MPNDYIRPYDANPRYWQYKEQPVLLLGGSLEDNLFQISDLETHLDLLQSVGGNYVRCTMSSRDEGDVWPFAYGDGAYDLDQWNEEYWRRFANLLRWTYERDIIVQVEMWATFDFYPEWPNNPFNPKNNHNYTADEVELTERIINHPAYNANQFFWSIPAYNNQSILLKYQRRFVDKIVELTAPYGHVLYCMDNETHTTPEWGVYWAQYIRRQLPHAQTTQMWWQIDLSHPLHRTVVDNPASFTFCEVSQNNARSGMVHWQNLLRFREKLAPPRPMNNVKIYGLDNGPNWTGSQQDAIERFWRNIFGGCAAARFHRPSHGLGLNETAQTHIRSARLFADTFDVTRDDIVRESLTDEHGHNVYMMAVPGWAYAVFFPQPFSSIQLVIDCVGIDWQLYWLDIEPSCWQKSEFSRTADHIALTGSCKGPSIALVTRSENKLGKTSHD